MLTLTVDCPPTVNVGWVDTGRRRKSEVEVSITSEAIFYFPFSTVVLLPMCQIDGILFCPCCRDGGS